MAKLVAAGGTLPALEEETSKLARSPRRKGVQQGVILVMIGIVLLPLINVAVSPPYNEALLFVFLLGGILRALYALSFQEGKLRESEQIIAPSQIGENKSNSALPPPQVAMSDFNERRVETAEMVKLPDDITENTTKILDEQNNLNAR
ncbi:MAG: hypothetical protein LC776_16290 [Acidobacteria bacterium]|nr:hypothetical protein [Acidobacteriota bacterium]